MLQLKEIKKDYVVGDTKVHALKDISLSFRESEFVSILGPSGCGKTTMLNIIGGLDHYTSGDLIIENVSTKNYSSRDWDTYRNHKVGFIFQSYNLIPHQTILENVELALNISGVEKKERVRRAKKALDKVGLKNQYNKKPNQLSGGQCQRVAIARALVNDPEILLADEPTGALDSETSVQIMDLIKEIANECLVIMVTHNPELADKYSTRIIKLLDGKVLSDSNPYNPEEESKNIVIENKVAKKKSKKKSKLSFWSAFKLSAKNLYSKFKRTFMVCLAGSIGIIGVASVLAVSTGVQGYITSMQNDMLSGNPITISEESLNLNALMSTRDTIMTKDAIKASTKDGYINVDYMIDYLVERSGDLSSLKVSNDITEDYVTFVKNMPKEYYSAISTNYGLNLSNNLYTAYQFNNQTNNNMSLTTALQIYTEMLNKTEGYESFAQYISLYSSNFMQSINNEEFILSQYDMIAGDKIATAENEIMIVLSDENALTDLLLAQFGYYSQDQFFNIVYHATESNQYNQSLWKENFSYEEILGKTFTYYPNDQIFTKTSISEMPFTYSGYQNNNWENGIELKITAILKPKEDLSYGCLESGFYYTEALANKIITLSQTSQIVTYLKENNKTSLVSIYADDTRYSGITYKYSFELNGTEYKDCLGFVGSSSSLGLLTGQASDTKTYSLTLRELGGNNIPSTIKIYPKDFDLKDQVTNYLNTWNSNQAIEINNKILSSDDRQDIQYTDNLSIVIGLVNNLVNIVTTALVAFTALSLVVSTVMVAIITYVSVMERVKEIGVIRSLGGRKRDVSSLFIAETFIIGGVSGIIGIGITYAISGIINLIVGNAFGIYTIATLPIPTALIMIAISIGLTLISGLIPASLAAKKDPVEALRTE